MNNPESSQESSPVPSPESPSPSSPESSPIRKMFKMFKSKAERKPANSQIPESPEVPGVGLGNSENPETPTPQKPEKPQEQLRESLKKRFSTLTKDTQSTLDDYVNSLADGTFDDKEGEEAGAGEKRRETAQSKIRDMMDRAKKMKRILDSKEDLPQTTPQMEATYTHTNPTTRKVERTETITLDIEKKTQEFLDFYKKTNINLPPDFRETVLDIWERNYDEIQKAVEQNGFDDILLLPANIPLTELSDKMKMGNGYYLGDNFKEGGGFAGAISQNVDKPRIILVHRTQNLKDRPELAKTLNIRGQDVNLNEILTLEDYLIFGKKYFDETTKHLDEIGATWLSTKSGARLVDSDWNPDSDRLSVLANGPGNRYESLGARPSRSFF